jgi:hypothetical protein
LSAIASEQATRDSGKRIARKARLILLVQRNGNVFRFAVMTRIVHAHHALRVGEFEDHIGHQITLRQQTGAGGMV